MTATAVTAATAGRNVPLMPGDVVGDDDSNRWRVVRHIAEGGFSSVYEAQPETPATRLRHGTPSRALKCLWGTPAELTAIGGEAAKMAAVEGHQNVLGLVSSFRFGLDAQPSAHYVGLVLELAAEDLPRFGARVRPSERAWAGVFEQVAAGLEHIHSRRVVHGDIKPTNLLRIDGRFAVADFGVSAPLESTRSAGIGLARTIAFWPPESASQGVLGPDGVRLPPAEGWRATQQGDVWALAVSMHRLLTGRHITPGTTPEHQYELVCLGKYSVDDRLGPGWRRLLADCLVREPAHRVISTAAELRARLADLALDDQYAGVPWPEGQPRVVAVLDLGRPSQPDPAVGPDAAEAKTAEHPAWPGGGSRTAVDPGRAEDPAAPAVPDRRTATGPHPAEPSGTPADPKPGAKAAGSTGTPASPAGSASTPSADPKAATGTAGPAGGAGTPRADPRAATGTADPAGAPAGPSTDLTALQGTADSAGAPAGPPGSSATPSTDPTALQGAADPAGPPTGSPGADGKPAAEGAVLSALGTSTVRPSTTATRDGDSGPATGSTGASTGPPGGTAMRSVDTAADSTGTPAGPSGTATPSADIDTSAVPAPAGPADLPVPAPRGELAEPATAGEVLVLYQTGESGRVHGAVLPDAGLLLAATRHLTEVAVPALAQQVRDSQRAVLRLVDEQERTPGGKAGPKSDDSGPQTVIVDPDDMELTRELTVAVAGVTRQRDELAQDRDRLVRHRDELTAERDRLRQQYVDLAHRLDRLEAERRQRERTLVDSPTTVLQSVGRTTAPQPRVRTTAAGGARAPRSTRPTGQPRPPTALGRPPRVVPARRRRQHPVARIVFVLILLLVFAAGLGVVGAGLATHRDPATVVRDLGRTVLGKTG